MKQAFCKQENFPFIYETSSPKWKHGFSFHTRNKRKISEIKFSLHIGNKRVKIRIWFFLLFLKQGTERSGHSGSSPCSQNNTNPNPPGKPGGFCCFHMETDGIKTIKNHFDLWYILKFSADCGITSFRNAIRLDLDHHDAFRKFTGNWLEAEFQIHAAVCFKNKRKKWRNMLQK